ncbi:MAG TPA: hypothetical protein VK581_01540 [Chthoniobacterales bacterium]|nr:hypothetical protein [Chthoniobacterales bacterium]
MLKLILVASDSSWAQPGFFAFVILAALVMVVSGFIRHFHDR